MANDFRRVSPGMYQGPNGQIVRSQQRPVQKPQPMGPQGPQVGGWRSGPNMPPPAPMGQPIPGQGMVGIGGFEQQQQNPYFGGPPRGFGDSFQGGQAGGWQQPPMPPQGMPPQPMGPPPPPNQEAWKAQEMMRPKAARSLIGKLPQSPKGPAGILTQPPKGNYY
jgi:hypothetical protein